MGERRGSTSTNSRPSVWRLWLVAIGFIGLAVGVFAAWNAPASHYEVSIYTATPLSYWIGIGIAFAAAGLVTVVRCWDGTAALAMVLGGLATVSIGALPAIRGYRYYGQADALTHLGWTRELRDGLTDYFDLFYPGGHSSSVLFGELAGVSTEHAIMVFTAILVGVFILFVPLSTGAIVNGRRPVAIAAFSGFMLLPFTTVSTMLNFHAYSFALLVLPLFIYLLVKYAIEDHEAPRTATLTRGWKHALVASGVAILLFHPQVKLNVVILVGTLVAFNILYRHRRQISSITLQPMAGVFVVLGGAWIVWMLSFPEHFGTGERVLDETRGVLFGTAEPGETVTATAQSADAIGVNIWELFVKILLIPAIYTLISAWVIVDTFRGNRLASSNRTATVIRQFGVAGIVLMPFFLLHYAGAISHLFFRHIGFVFVFATILGAIGLSILADRMWQPKQRHIGHLVIVGGAIIVLGLALMIVYPSPYIYNQSHHATEAQFDGFDQAFAHGDEAVPFSGIRQPPVRFTDAIATDRSIGMVSAINNSELMAPTLRGDRPFYLPMASVDIEREVTAYHQLRYDQQTLDATSTHPGFNRVHANQDFTLYYVAS